MKPAPFAYHAPAAIDEAVGLLRELGDEAKVLAGGQSLVPILALRLTAFSHLIDLAGVAALRGIQDRADRGLEVGAMTTQAQLADDPAVAGRVPLVARAAALIGHFQIRNRGTLGGSLAHADAAAELPAVALALEAELRVAGPDGDRVVPAEAFFLGDWTTALASDEILTAARFPAHDGHCGHAVEEVSRRPGDFALAGAACRVEVGPEGRIRDVAVALFGVGDRPLRNREIDRQLGGEPAATADLAGFAGDLIAATAPRDDVHATAAYRAHVGRVVVERAMRRALHEATHD